MIARRHFIQSAIAAAAASQLQAQSPAPDWGGPVLDIHLHYRPGLDTNLEHMKGCGVSNAVLLTQASAEEQVKATIAAHPKNFVRFVSADIRKPESFDLLKKSAMAGAIGFGEIKFHLANDGPEMTRLYDLAADLKVPVLIHFADFDQVPGEGPYSGPFKNLPNVLKKHPKTTFIAHADGFWANISADVQPTPYPEGKVKPGGLSDKLLADFGNLYADMSANSGNNAINRDREFYAGFVKRHQDKLMFGCDCSCSDGRGKGQGSKQPRIAGKCVARETLSALKEVASPAIFRKVTWENGVKLLKIKA